MIFKITFCIHRLIIIQILPTENGLKFRFETRVTGAYYTKHLSKDLIPACEKLYKNNDFIFMQDGATSHTSNLCQNFLKEKLGKERFVDKTEWPPKSPDLNVLDYYFWDRVQNKVYEGRTIPFDNLGQLKRRIKNVWYDTAELDEIQRSVLQFRKRLIAVVANKGGPIKSYYG